MEESKVEYHVKCLLERHGWRKAPPELLPFESDIVYVKGDERYIIEAKGETKGGPSWLIKYAIGETVAQMRLGGENVHYGIALPHSIAFYLSKFGLEGLRRCNLHLFIVEEVGIVWHLAPEMVPRYVKELQSGRNSPSLLSSPP